MKHITQFFRWIGRCIAGFFFYLSNTDPELVAKCSFWARAKGVLIGVLITLSSILAGFSMYYFIIEATKEQSAAIAFAILWMLTVMHIEKSVYLAVSKWAVLVRIAMILVISFLVSLPLKVNIFKEALDDQIAEMEHEKKLANYQGVADQHAKSSGFRQKLVSELNELKDKRLELIRKRDAEKAGLQVYNGSGKRGRGPKYDAFQDQVELTEKSIQDKKEQIKKADIQAAKDETKATKLYEMKNEGITHNDSFFYKYKGYKRLLASEDKLTRDTTIELSLIVYLVLIIIELSPVLLKSLLPKTDYDHIILENQKLLKVSQDYRGDTMASRIEYIGSYDYSEAGEEQYKERIRKYNEVMKDLVANYESV